MSEPKYVVYAARAEAPPLEFDETAVEVDRVESIAATLDQLDNADCVVSGARLADGTVQALCDAVRSKRPDVPLVVYTDDGSERLAGDVIAAGADGYVPAPAGIETLAARIDDLVSTPSDAGDAGTDDRLELLIDQSPLAIIEWNLDFEAVSWNPAATELFGYSKSEAIGELGPDELVPPEDRDSVLDGWNELLETVEYAQGINRNVTKDERLISCEWFNTPLVDDQGDVLSVLSFARDVTEELTRADALETLQETTHRLMRASSTDEIAEILVDATEDVIKRPRAAVRLFDDETGRLELADATEQLSAHADIAPIGPGDGPIWTGFDRGDTTIVDDASANFVPYDVALDRGNAIVQPIGDRGVLTVASKPERPLGETDFHLVDVLAATADVALERAEHDHELDRAKTIIETVGDGIYALDTDGQFTTVNDTFSAMVGYSQDDLVGTHASTVLGDESGARVTENSSELLTAGDDAISTMEIDLVHRSGERLPCEVTTTVLRDGDEIEGTVGIVRDVSDRKAMERELLDRQRKIATLHDVVSQLEECETEQEIYELAVDAAEGVLNFDVCVVSVADGEYLEVAAVSSHVSADRFQHRRHVDVGLSGKTYRERRSFRIDDVSESSDANPQDVSFESALSVPMGEYGVFQAISTEPAAFDAKDEELAELLISHVTDALDQRSYEAQLVAERDRFAVLFENVPDAVVSGPHVDDDLIVENVNSAFERVFGYEETELVGKPLDDLIVPAGRTEEAKRINERSEAGQVIETEVRRRTADGLRDFMLRVVPFEVEGRGDHAFGVYTDITDQKQRQKRVEVLNRVLRHDLRNGMNIIQGSAEMLAASADGEEADRFAAAITERTRELIGLAEKTRAVERTLDRGDAATGPVDVVAGVHAAVDRIEEEYPEAIVDCRMPDRALVRADDLLQEAIFHVVENGVEHADRPQPTIEISLTDSTREPETLVLSVADDGPGIPDEERELLEEDREITQLRHASGLGLWLVDWVVTQSGGELVFGANEPRGTVVELHLPAASDAPTDVLGDGATVGD